MRVLVTGGAGYIGAHAVRDLIRRGDDVTVVDDLSTGRSERLDGVELVTMDLRRVDVIPELAELLSHRRIDAVIHFAAQKSVEASIAKPAEYMLANVGATAVVLASMRDSGCRRLVFSSTAAVYGDIDGQVAEDAPVHPLTPYGASKLSAEQLVQWAAAADGLSAVSLRYFNVAGSAHPDFVERGAPNLIPQVIARLDAGERPGIFGDDYPTPDGTCVRDYVHVADVSEAHLAVLDATGEPGSRLYNIGTGTGTSVAEIVRAICEARNVPYDPEVLPRRAGDSATAVADIRRIRTEIGWVARRGLDEIIRSVA